MAAEFAGMGSWPTAPAQFIGRDTDIEALRSLLTKNFEKLRSGVVRLDGTRLKEARARLATKTGKPATLENLAERTGLSLEGVKRPEAGKPVLMGTAAAIARALDTSVDELLATSGESIALQTLVTVHGLPGVGKTTIASRLAHDPDLKRKFEGCLWASLGESPDSLGELKAWGRALGVDIDQEKDAKHARARLTAWLSQKRLLIIIDDAWTSDAAFDLMVGGPRCATLVTTRFPNVANAIAPTEADIYHLDVLSEEDAVKLLTDLASGVFTEYPLGAAELAKELERLPLALHVAALLLREEKRNTGGVGLTQLLKHLQDPANLLDKDAPGGSKVRALLNKSIDVLDERAQTCFAFLSPFAEKPAHFDQRALNALWDGIAENPEQMRDLFIARGLLEPVLVRERPRFWLHSLLLAYARSLLAARGSGATQSGASA